MKKIIMLSTLMFFISCGYKPIDNYTEKPIISGIEIKENCCHYYGNASNKHLTHTH